MTRTAKTRRRHPKSRRRQLRWSTAGARGAFLRVAAVVAAATGVAFNDIVLSTGPGTMRRARVRFARQAALYLTVTFLDVRAGTLARALGRPRWRISSACHAAEDARDRADVDALYARLEAML